MMEATEQQVHYFPPPTSSCAASVFPTSTHRQKHHRASRNISAMCWTVCNVLCRAFKRSFDDLNEAYLLTHPKNISIYLHCVSCLPINDNYQRKMRILNKHSSKTGSRFPIHTTSSAISSSLLYKPLIFPALKIAHQTAWHAA